MEKKYKIIEINKAGQKRLMATAITKRSAFDIIENLKVRHSENTYIVQISSGKEN